MKEKFKSQAETFAKNVTLYYQTTTTKNKAPNLRLENSPKNYF